MYTWISTICKKLSTIFPTSALNNFVFIFDRFHQTAGKDDAKNLKIYIFS